MNSIEVPYSIFEEGVERANKLAYKPSPGVMSEDSAITIPFSVFEEGIRIANEKAYCPSKGLENF